MTARRQRSARAESASDDAEIARWTPVVPMLVGRGAKCGAKYGGQLVLTTRRLVWMPLLISTVAVAGGYALPIDVGGTRWESAPVDIDDVAPELERRGLLHVVANDGIRTPFLVAAGRFTPVWSRKNRVARDDAVGQIAAAVRAA